MALDLPKLNKAGNNAAVMILTRQTIDGVFNVAHACNLAVFAGKGRYFTHPFVGGEELVVSRFRLGKVGQIIICLVKPGEREFVHVEIPLAKCDLLRGFLTTLERKLTLPLKELLSKIQHAQSDEDELDRLSTVYSCETGPVSASDEVAPVGHIPGFSPKEEQEKRQAADYGSAWGIFG